MVIFYFITLAVTAVLVLLLCVAVSDRYTDNSNPLLENQDTAAKEMYKLLDVVNNSFKTDDARKARYHDIRKKYKDTFAALGYDFPEYKGR